MTVEVLAAAVTSSRPVSFAPPGAMAPPACGRRGCSDAVGALAVAGAWLADARLPSASMSEGSATRMV